MRLRYYRRLVKCLDVLATSITAKEDITIPAEWINTELENIAKSRWLWPGRDIERIEALWGVIDRSVINGRYDLAVLAVQGVIQRLRGRVTHEAISAAIAFAVAGLVIGLLGLWL